jgi:hypothetical protein
MNLLQKSIDLKLQEKLCTKTTILYVYCVDLLMWSQTKIDFSILWFFKYSVKKKKDKAAFENHLKPGQGGKMNDFKSWGK